jgi:hypothetical protein
MFPSSIAKLIQKTFGTSLRLVGESMETMQTKEAYMSLPMLIVPRIPRRVAYEAVLKFRLAAASTHSVIDFSDSSIGCSFHLAMSSSNDVAVNYSLCMQDSVHVFCTLLSGTTSSTVSEWNTR